MDEQVLAAELRKRHGVTSRAALRGRGFSDREITGLLHRDRLIGVGGGVLVDPASPPTFEQRVVVACAITGGVAQFPTAGQLWSFRKTPRCPEIHVCIPERRRAGDRPGIVVHRCRDLPATDVVTSAPTE